MKESCPDVALAIGLNTSLIAHTTVASNQC
jgi:hypothetical protein